MTDSAKKSTKGKKKAAAKKAGKKPISAERLEQSYWHHLLTHGSRPKSVYAFAGQAEMKEADFYQHAASFEALEAGYWDRLIEETIDVLHEDADYADYAADQKLLAFYYTFFAHAQANRSRLVEFFPRPGCIKGLKPMRHRYVEFVKDIIQQGLDDGSIADRKQLTEKYPQLLFEQFRGMIEYYRRDQSDNFQDTDAMIEKSVRFSADLARSGTLDSAFDLGRFLLRKFILTNA